MAGLTKNQLADMVVQLNEDLKSANFANGNLMRKNGQLLASIRKLEGKLSNLKRKWDGTVNEKRKFRKLLENPNAAWKEIDGGKGDVQ